MLPWTVNMINTDVKSKVPFYYSRLGPLGAQPRHQLLVEAVTTQIETGFSPATTVLVKFTFFVTYFDFAYIIIPFFYFLTAKVAGD